MHKIKIEATLNEEVDAEGVGIPQSVRIKGAGFLQASAITDIAQEVLDSLSADYSREYISIRPDSEMITDDMTVPVIKRRV